MSNDIDLPPEDRASGEPFEPPKTDSSKLSGANAAYYYKQELRDKIEEDGDKEQLKRAVENHRAGEVDFRKSKTKVEHG